MRVCACVRAHGCSAGVCAHPASERSVWDVKSAPIDTETKLVVDNSYKSNLTLQSLQVSALRGSVKGIQSRNNKSTLLNARKRVDLWFFVFTSGTETSSGFTDWHDITLHNVKQVVRRSWSLITVSTSHILSREELRFRYPCLSTRTNNRAKEETAAERCVTLTFHAP